MGHFSRTCCLARALACAGLVVAAGCYTTGEKPGADVSTDAGPDLEPVVCPDDMVAVDGRYCIDRWEASRQDATATSMGEDTSIAVSIPGVRPWATGSTGAEYETVTAACAAAGKRLCRPDEWFRACGGPDEQAYCYGDEYDPVACNGIDAFCADPSPGCGLEEGGFHVTVTGSFSGCTNEYGLFDINGNLWEWVEDPELVVRGGAFNCGNSALLHACDYTSPAAYRSAIGFRCCR